MERAHSASDVAAQTIREGSGTVATLQTSTWSDYCPSLVLLLCFLFRPLSQGN